MVEPMFRIRPKAFDAVDIVSAFRFAFFFADRDMDVIDELDNAISHAGFLTKGEFGLPGWCFFIKCTETKRMHPPHISLSSTRSV